MVPLLMGYLHMNEKINHHLNILQIQNLISLSHNPMSLIYLLILNHDGLPYVHVILEMHFLSELISFLYSIPITYLPYNFVHMYLNPYTYNTKILNTYF
jgi:hypothetical protein